MRARCGGCGHDRLVAFSCKHRGVCSNCGGRRMSETAARQCDRVTARGAAVDREGVRGAEDGGDGGSAVGGGRLLLGGDGGG